MILLTGATGLLGSHLLSTGLARGERFRAVSRDVLARSYLATVRERVETVSLDLLSERIDPALFRDVDVVVHCAGLASPFPRDGAAMRALNVEATTRLVDAALAAGVRRWVQISSVAALAGGAGAAHVDEEGSPTPRDGDYARSKWEADRAVEARATSDADDVALVTIHPTYMLGRWDARPSSGAVLLALRLGRLRHYVEGKKNFVAAADVAKGIWQAHDAGVRGPYLLGGVDVSIGAFLRQACEAVGVDPGTIAPLGDDALADDPSPRRRAVLAADEAAIVREFCAPSSVTSAKARRDFGYAPTSALAPLLAETVEYLRSARLLPRLRP